MDEFNFDDPNYFPDKDDLCGVIMLKDGSLEVRAVTGSPRRTNVTFKCPKKTRMHEWLLSLTGPMYPGVSHLFLDKD